MNGQLSRGQRRLIIIERNHVSYCRCTEIDIHFCEHFEPLAACQHLYHSQSIAVSIISKDSSQTLLPHEVPTAVVGGSWMASRNSGQCYGGECLGARRLDVYVLIMRCIAYINLTVGEDVNTDLIH